MRYVVGIDVGGTFTDCVLVDEDGKIRTDKSFSVPGNPGEGMIHALENATKPSVLSVQDVLAEARAVAIGTTSLTNRLVTRSGAKVGLITTKGHEDAVVIGRILAKSAGLGEAERMDQLHWSKPAPIATRRFIKGVTERIDYKGAVVVALNRDEVESVVEELVADGVEAIAVSFLWAFLNPAHERWIQEFIEHCHPSVYVALGSAVAPVLGEYERTNAAILSAHLGAAARQEMETTRELLANHGLSRPFLVMQSNGGCMWHEEVAVRPLNLIASGPAGGVIGAAKLGERLGYGNIIAADMGGTSFDVGVIADGSPLLSDIAVYDRIQLALPHVEIVSIGAGGGSIAMVDPTTGMIQVGPRSAGAVPGPVAYDQGGEEPTVTDADVVLGRIDPDAFFNGRKALDKAKAEAVIKARIADALGCDVLQAAQGILDIVDSQMGDLIRRLTIERGVDPRDFVLFAYGGAGPTHVGAFAQEVGIFQAVISPYASVFSALGISSSDIVRVYSSSSPLRSPFHTDRLNELFDRLEEQAGEEMAQRGVESERTNLSLFLDMRFRHQVHQVRVPVPGERLSSSDVDQIVDRFVGLYEQSFGRGTAVTEAGVEIMTFHVVATTHHVALTLREDPMQGEDTTAARIGSRPVYFSDGFLETPILRHAALVSGNKVTGPALVEGANTTLVIHPGQEASVDGFGNVVLRFADQTT